MSQVSPGPFLFHFHRSYPWRRLQQYATLRPRDRLIRKYCNLYLSLSGGLLRLCRKEDDVDEKMQKKNSNVTYRRNVQRKTNILLKKSSKKGFNRCTILIYKFAGNILQWVKSAKQNYSCFKAIKPLTTHFIQCSPTNLNILHFSLLFKPSKFKPSQKNNSSIIELKWKRFACNQRFL